MFANRFSIGQVMKVVAMVAVDLAIIRATPMGIVNYPPLWALLGMLDFVIVWKLILRRTFRAFHYTFMIVSVIVFCVSAMYVATEQLHPLGRLVRWYQQLSGEQTSIISVGSLGIGEFWMAGSLSFVLAWAFGLVAMWLERRRNWDIAAFFRGTFVGFAVATLLLTLADVAAWGNIVSPAQFSARMVLLVVCLILGGRMGLSRMKSISSSRASRGGNTEASL